MASANFTGFLIAIGLFLMILSPALVFTYVILTGTLGVYGILSASIGTIMIINFFNVEKQGLNTISLFLGPALIILGFYLMINF